MTVEVGHAQRERTTSRSPNSRPFREPGRRPDGVLEFDVAAAGAFLTEVANACREIEVITNDEDPWPEILTSISQPKVDAWRAAHEAEVEAIYSPPVPEWEIEACRQVYQQASSDPNTGAVKQAALDVAMGLIEAQSGKTGRDALYDLWRAEQMLLLAAG